MKLLKVCAVGGACTGPVIGESAVIFTFMIGVQFPNYRCNGAGAGAGAGATSIYDTFVHSQNLNSCQILFSLSASSSTLPPHASPRFLLAAS